MSHDKLRGWLSLPDGPWPPGHYALIGLEPGAGTPQEIEGRVLERLELLRRYQLPHPDEATEGMNLLARALDTLTDPDARREYDQSLGLKPPTRPGPSKVTLGDELDTLFESVPRLPIEKVETVQATVSAEPVADEPLVLDAINALPELEEEPDVDDDPEFLAEPPAVELLPPAILLPAPVARLEAEPASPKRPRSPRRELYADLARVRRVLRIWERARPYVTDTDRTFNRRTDTLALMGCLAELRPLLHTVSDLVAAPKRPGNLIAALARQRLHFDTFRSLLPDQRDALARDFRAAHYRLAGYYDDLRAEASRLTEKDWSRRALWPALAYIGDHPEWVVLPFALSALVIALVRSF